MTNEPIGMAESLRRLWEQKWFYFFVIQLYLLAIFLFIQWLGYDSYQQRIINQVDGTVQVLLDKVKNGTQVTLEDVDNVRGTIKHWKREYFQAIKNCKVWYDKTLVSW